MFFTSYVDCLSFTADIFCLSAANVYIVNHIEEWLNKKVFYLQILSPAHNIKVF